MTATGRMGHGTRQRYIKGCRCEPCRESNRVYLRRWRQRQAHRLCSEPGCGRTYYAGDRCRTHYWALQPRPECSIDGCDAPVVAAGMCSLHYQRRRDHGDPHALDADLVQARLRWLRDTLGASDTWIGQHLGVARSRVWQLRNGNFDRVHRSTVDAVEQLVDRVRREQLLPPGYAAARDREIARNSKRRERTEARR